MASIVSVHTARKQRVCGLGCEIPAGQKYRRWVATPGDSEVGNERWWHCEECAACAESANRSIPGQPGPEALAVDAWNARYPVGAPVEYWTGFREGPGKTSITRTPAQLLSGVSAVVWVEGQGSCISLSHVEPTGGGE